MAVKILALSSSPRKNSNSDILCDKILAGASRADVEVEKINLHGLTIKPCIACESCQKSIEEPCIYDDDMVPLVEKIRAANGLIFASPIYFFTVNAQMKLLLDRFLQFFGEGKFDTLAGKKAAIALTYGAEDPLESGVTCAHDMFQNSFKFLGIDMAGCTHASCRDAGEVEKNTKALENAFQLGQKLATQIAG